MSHLTRLVALVLFLGVAGCDGYGRLLYLKPPAASRPPWSSSSAIIEIQGDEDVRALLADVAGTLGVHANPNDPDQWVRVYNDGGSSFTMSVARKADGLWTVSLIDWPSIRRSDLSVQVEQAIRSALESGEEGAASAARNGSSYSLLPEHRFDEARRSLPQIRDYALEHLPHLTPEERMIIATEDPVISHANYVVYYFSWKNSLGYPLATVEAFAPPCEPYEVIDPLAKWRSNRSLEQLPLPLGLGDAFDMAVGTTSASQR